MVDTGASASLIKACKLTPDTKFNSKEKLTLLGLSPNNPVKTIGTCNIPLENESNAFMVKFHILNEATNVPYDGLLGKDFFQNESAVIDYDNQTLLLKSLSTPLKLLSENSKSTQKTVVNDNCYAFKLNPRSETLVEIPIENFDIREGILPEVEFQKGVYLSKAIVNVNENNKAFASILNTRIVEQEIIIKPVTLEPLPNNSFIFSIIQDTNNLTNRLELLRNNLRLEHLNQEERNSIINICKTYSDLFYLPDDQLTHTSTLEHEINLTNPTPINTKSYRYPEIHKQEVNKQIDKMLKQGIIKPSISPWSAPLWVVPKKLDASKVQKWRLVIDYRRLNDVTIGDAFPLPQIDEILDQLGHSKYFSTLDLASGFHQIPVKDSDQQKTAFTTPLGHYEFTRMPFGLKNAPSTFQRLMNSVLSGLQGLQCFVYLDDVVIYASSLEEHTLKLKTIFDRLRLNNLKLQPDKCEFLKREVSYLGHVISEQGVQPNPEKVNAIKNYPVPKDAKMIKQFLGLVGYYRRFIKNFAKIAKPLTNLLKKEIPFSWTNEHQTSFDTFRNILLTSPILSYPDFSKEFILTTDASNFAIGAILSQGKLGSDLPIAYASRTLNNSEQNFSTTEKELLAIVWSVKHFRPYLYGRTFTIVTDHKPLTWLFNCKDPGSRLVRWRLKLAEYDYKIEYKAGKLNSNADALSRIEIKEPQFRDISQSSNTTSSYQEFVKSKGKFPSNINITEVDKNLFKISEDYSLAHCVSADLKCSKGIAIEFRNRYGELDRLRSQPPHLHEIVYLKQNNRYIFYMITKNMYFNKPTYEDVFITLSNLKQICIEKGISKLAMPKIACGLDNLNWLEIKSMIHYIFRDSKIIIKLCSNHQNKTTGDITKANNPIPITVVRKDDHFQNFIEFHYKTLNIPRIDTLPFDNFKHFPNALFYSKDLDNNNFLADTLKECYDDVKNLQEPDDLHSIIELKTNSKTSYLCIYKQFHFSKTDYKDVFYCLRNLRTKLIHNNHSGNIYIQDVSINNKNIKREMFFEMIYYIFKDTSYKPVILVRQRIKPKTKEEIVKILEDNHDSKLSGHSGFTRTYKRIKELYKWDSMKKDIKNYIKRCPSCQINKTNFKPTKAPMEITTTSNQPFERLAIDIVGPLPQTINNNRFILTMQDDLTKYSYAVAIPNHESRTVAEQLSKFITLFGIPKVFLSDQGTDFTSQLIKDLTKLFKTKHLLSSPYHPQTNGALERSHLTLKDYLKHYLNDKQSNWDELISFAMFAYNTHVHRSTGHTPYETLFGHKPYLPNTITEEPSITYSYDDYITNLKQKLNTTQKIARENIIQSKETSKRYYDHKLNPHKYKVNDLVYILNKQNIPNLNKKLSPNYIGPFEIVKVFQNNTVQVKKGRKFITYHTNLLKPVVAREP